MENLKFFLIGDGRIAQYHKEAMKKLGGDIFIYDPIKYPSKRYATLESEIGHCNADYVVICSPSHHHREQTLIALKYNIKVIVEKPAALPWEPLVDDDRIHVVLQLRYLENLPEKAELIKVSFVRDEEYFKSWKGDSKLTGGIFYTIFIHYIDLALRLGAKFEGTISSFGKQDRWIGVKWSHPKEVPHDDRYRFVAENDKIDLEKINMQDLYDSMYEDVVLNENHIKPRDIFHLNWVLDRCNWDYGLGGKDIFGKKIVFDPKDM